MFAGNNSVGIYAFKAIEAPDQYVQYVSISHYSAFVVNFRNFSHIALVFLLLTLNKKIPTRYATMRSNTCLKSTLKILGHMNVVLTSLILILNKYLLK